MFCYFKLFPQVKVWIPIYLYFPVWMLLSLLIWGIYALNWYSHCDLKSTVTFIFQLYDVNLLHIQTKISLTDFTLILYYKIIYYLLPTIIWKSLGITAFQVLYILPIEWSCFWLFFPRCISYIFPGWITFHFLPILLTTLGSFYLPSLFLSTLSNLVSSVNLINMMCILSYKSLMKFFYNLFIFEPLMVLNVYSLAIFLKMYHFLAT